MILTHSQHSFPLLLVLLALVRQCQPVLFTTPSGLEVKSVISTGSDVYLLGNSSSTGDAALHCYSSTGTTKYTMTYSQYGSSSGQNEVLTSGSLVTTDGNKVVIYAAGSTEPKPEQSSSSSRNILVMKLDASNGAFMSRTTFGTSNGDDSGYGISANMNSIFVSGELADTASRPRGFVSRFNQTYFPDGGRDWTRSAGVSGTSTRRVVFENNRVFALHYSDTLVTVQDFAFVAGTILTSDATVIDIGVSGRFTSSDMAVLTNMVVIGLTGQPIFSSNMPTVNDYRMGSKSAASTTDDLYVIGISRTTGLVQFIHQFGLPDQSELTVKVATKRNLLVSCVTNQGKSLYFALYDNLGGLIESSYGIGSVTYNKVQLVDVTAYDLLSSYLVAYVDAGTYKVDRIAEDLKDLALVRQITDQQSSTAPTNHTLYVLLGIGIAVFALGIVILSWRLYQKKRKLEIAEEVSKSTGKMIPQIIPVSTSTALLVAASQTPYNGSPGTSQLNVSAPPTRTRSNQQVQQPSQNTSVQQPHSGRSTASLQDPDSPMGMNRSRAVSERTPIQDMMHRSQSRGRLATTDSPRPQQQIDPMPPPTNSSRRNDSFASGTNAAGVSPGTLNRRTDSNNNVQAPNTAMSKRTVTNVKRAQSRADVDTPNPDMRSRANTSQTESPPITAVRVRKDGATMADPAQIAARQSSHSLAINPADPMSQPAPPMPVSVPAAGSAHSNLLSRRNESQPSLAPLVAIAPYANPYQSPYAQNPEHQQAQFASPPSPYAQIHNIPHNGPGILIGDSREVTLSNQQSSEHTQQSSNDFTTTFTQVKTMISNQKELAIPGFLQYKPGIDYDVQKALARGGAGQIFLAQIISFELSNRANGSKSCVAKIINMESSPTKEEIASFSQEISIMWYFRTSRNISKLLGFTNTPPTIIMRHYERGALTDLIYKDSLQIYNPQLVYSLLRDIATGIRDMHDAGFVHCDIKPANILLDEDEKGVFAVLTDFGISRIITQTSVVIVDSFQIAKVEGASVAYAAPEVLERIITENSGTISTEGVKGDKLKAGDVYSFSMVAYELINRCTPWPRGISMHEVINRVTTGERPKLTPEVEQLKLHDSVVNGMLELMRQCWVDDPYARLQMGWVLEILEQIRKSSQIRLL